MDDLRHPNSFTIDVKIHDCHIDYPPQHDWHCMAYAIFLLKQYHDGEL